jgi:hypothetical protein
MNTNLNLLVDNNLIYYGLFISCGLLLSCSIYYLIISNYNAIPTNNIEALTEVEIEPIMNENTVTTINSDNIDAIIDYASESDSETDIASDYQSTFDSDSDTDTESILDIADLDLFFMPNVDFDVCSIYELKYFEISSIFYKEIAEKAVTVEELTQLIWFFTEKQLLTNGINEFILKIITEL